jgi:hypothetical protein
MTWTKYPSAGSTRTVILVSDNLDATLPIIG